MQNDRGYTLVELVVVMAIFIVAIIMSSYAFENILRKGGQQGKSVASQIEGIVGLEMLRTDIGHAGFALPWSFQFSPPAYKEIGDGRLPAAVAIGTTSFDAVRDIPPALPRAVVTGSANGGPDYLVLKSALLALDTTTIGRWGFLNFVMNGVQNVSTISRTADATDKTSLRAGTNPDRVITLLSAFSVSGEQTRQLMMTNAGSFSDAVQSTFVPTNDAYKPADSSQTLIAYGISDRSLNMPYNRADYYVFRPAAGDPNFKTPASCNPGAGILFKAVAGHNGDYTGKNGEKLIYPLLNCVGDMKVAYSLDMNDDGNPGTYFTSYDAGDASVTPLFSSESASIASVQATLADASLMRKRLKNVNVYILAHEGTKDINFSYPYSDASKVIILGDNGVGRTWTADAMAAAFGADWRNYRWKVYTIAVYLKNLQDVTGGTP